MNNSRQVGRDAEEALRRIFDDFGEVRLLRHVANCADMSPFDVVLKMVWPDASLLIGVEARTRITPQTAISLCHPMRYSGDVIPVVYAPVISPRVAEILEQSGVGFIDEAGNCRLRSARHGILIDRRGHKSPCVRPPNAAANPFSPKSSRIVRALLSQPAKGWKVRELGEHPDVGVALGLVSKVKRALVEEGYAIEHKRLIYLRDPIALLQNWVKKYSGPVEQLAVYFRGDTDTAEHAALEWARDNDIPCALAGFSAAWSLAPEVRYSVGAVYADNRGFDREIISRLSSYQGGKRVETGANLLLWRPFDRSVFADSQPASGKEAPVTSALQTFLDLKQLAGRGEEAATAVYEKHLAGPLHEATRWVEEIRHAAV